MKKSKEDRYWEIDFLRGIAVILMIGFHFLFDLHLFNLTDFRVPNEFAYLIATMFLLLVGISYNISYSRGHDGKYYLKRGLKIFSWGLIITGITWIAFPENVIVFGILHLIGISVILVYPLMEYKHLNLVLGSISIALGVVFYSSIQSLIHFPTFDYFPLLPWIGVVLIGLWLGKILYPDGERRFNIPEGYNSFIKGFCLLGRNSLLIYLVHQPVLVAAILALLNL